MLRENENRHKTPEQKIREGMTWEPIEKRKAEERTEEGQKSGGRGHKRDINSLKNFKGSLDVGNRMDIIASRVGLGSGITYEKGKAVVQQIDRFRTVHTPEIASRTAKSHISRTLEHWLVERVHTSSSTVLDTFTRGSQYRRRTTPVLCLYTQRTV